MISPDGKYFFFTSERGFADSAPAKPLSLADMERGAHGILNGLGNIYQVDIDALHLSK
jgi:hypothetical protein